MHPHLPVDRATVAAGAKRDRNGTPVKAVVARELDEVSVMGIRHLDCRGEAFQAEAAIPCGATSSRCNPVRVSGVLAHNETPVTVSGIAPSGQLLSESHSRAASHRAPSIESPTKSSVRLTRCDSISACRRSSSPTTLRS